MDRVRLAASQLPALLRFRLRQEAVRSDWKCRNNGRRKQETSNVEKMEAQDQTKSVKGACAEI